MRRKNTLIATTAAVIALAGGGFVAAGGAQAAPRGCTPVGDGTPYLAQYGDQHDYVQLGGAAFTAPGAWRTRNTSVDSAADAPDVTNDGPATLTIHPGGTAVSPSTCVAPEDDRVRFFYRAPAGTRVDMTITTRSGLGSTSYNTAVYAPTDGWELTPEILVPDWTDASGTQQVTVTIANRSGDDVQVDDVLLDPWRAKRW